MPSKANRKELTTRLDPELYEQLREATYRLRIPKQRAMIEALKMWLNANSPNALWDIPAGMIPVVECLAYLWRHKGTPEQESLKTSLKALATSHQTERRSRSSG